MTCTSRSCGPLRLKSGPAVFHRNLRDGQARLRRRAVGLSFSSIRNGLLALSSFPPLPTFPFHALFVLGINKSQNLRQQHLPVIQRR